MPTCLNGRQKYELARWMLEFKDAHARLINERVAERASEELGFPVSKNNVANIRRAHDLPRPGGGRSGAGGPPRDRTVILARAIRDLFIRLGEPCPPDVFALSHKKGHGGNGTLPELEPPR